MVHHGIDHSEGPPFQTTARMILIWFLDGNLVRTKADRSFEYAMYKTIQTITGIRYDAVRELIRDINVSILSIDWRKITVFLDTT